MKQVSELKKRILSFVLAFLFASAAPTWLPADANAEQKPIPQDVIKQLNDLSNSLATVVDAVRPAVVNISTKTTEVVGENPFGDLFNDPFFRRFFGDRVPGPPPDGKRRVPGLGSGVIVSDDGYILTNNHVIQGADQIKVILYDKREFTGKVVGADSKTDLAVVKIEAKGLPVLKLAESANLRAGEIVLAVGSPFALNQTITMGIVSAVGRSNIGVADFEDFIQTDAAINPGNSGGALINTGGQLVGINTAIFSTSGGYMGVGFAIPSDMARSVLNDIIKHGRVIRGWLGVSIQDLTPSLAKALGIKQETGVLVADVVAGSPAEKAGLKRGDVITELNGKPVSDSRVLRNMVAEAGPGKTVKTTVFRDGKERTITAQLSEIKEKKEPAKKAEYDNPLKGVTVEELTPALRDQLNLPGSAAGVVVTGIDPSSPAAEELQAGDVILEVNRKDIRSLEEYERTVRGIGPKETVLLLIYRGGGTAYVTVSP